MSFSLIFYMYVKGSLRLLISYLLKSTIKPACLVAANIKSVKAGLLSTVLKGTVTDDTTVLSL